MIPGIDISEFQGVVNYPVLRASGQVDFVIARATYGVGGVDAQFVRNRENLRAEGIPHGFYHFAQGNDPATEARHFVATVSPLVAGEVLCLDEETGQNQAWCKVFLDTVLAETHVAPLIYASLSYFGDHSITYAGLGSKYGVWVADWSSTFPASPGGWPFVALWQQADNGSVPGIAGRVDLDFFNGDVGEFFKYGVPGTPPPVPPPVVVPPASTPHPAPSPTPPKAGDYVVRSGDTLSGIAHAYGCTLADLEKANPQITNPNLIFPGEVVHLPSGKAPTPPAAPPAHIYVVRPGDTLSGIAQSFRVSLLALERANPQIKNPNLIHPGDKVTIP